MRTLIQAVKSDQEEDAFKRASSRIRGQERRLEDSASSIKSVEAADEVQFFALHPKEIKVCQDAPEGASSEEDKHSHRVLTDGLTEQERIEIKQTMKLVYPNLALGQVLSPRNRPTGKSQS